MSILYFSLSTYAQSPGAPDLELEEQFHQIYLKYYQEATPEQEWTQVLGSGAKESYSISSGDNLWSISVTLFGDGNFWPKIWSINQRISNPHLIEPGNNIYFVLGSEESAPSVKVGEDSADDRASSDSESKPEAGEGELDEEVEIEIPPPTFPIRKLTHRIPPSLPAWHLNEKKENYDDYGISYARRAILDIEDYVFFHSYISEGEVETLGEVEEGERGSQMVASNQYVYVKIAPDIARMGDRFLVVYNRGKLKFQSKNYKGDAFNIEVQGEIVITDRVRERRIEERFELFRALITRIVNPVIPGAGLIKGRIKKVSLSKEGPRSNVVAQIVGGGLFSRRQIYGVQSLIYLDKGSSEGLRPGHILPIRANRQHRHPTTQVELNMRIVGWVRIIKTTPRLATGIIIETKGDIFTGDLTGTGITKKMFKAREKARKKRMSGALDKGLRRQTHKDARVMANHN